jgi:hypothetical protein
MTGEIVSKIDRIKYYTKRICESIGKNDPVAAMAQCAELGEIARRLYSDFAKVVRNRNSHDENRD